jgi:preprotein translocase subunit SecF
VFEVHSLFAVSLLTIAGYSVNDTVVIFDRIRENLKKDSDNYNKIIQISVNESFRRTFFTSITTLIPLLTLIIFGSYSLFWFSVSLTLGILIGSYSSILLAPSFLIKDNIP